MGSLANWCPSNRKQRTHHKDGTFGRYRNLTPNASATSGIPPAQWFAATGTPHRYRHCGGQPTSRPSSWRQKKTNYPWGFLDAAVWWNELGKISKKCDLQYMYSVSSCCWFKGSCFYYTRWILACKQQIHPLELLLMDDIHQLLYYIRTSIHIYISKICMYIYTFMYIYIYTYIYIEIPWNTLFIQCLLKHPNDFAGWVVHQLRPFPNWHLYSKFQHCLGICPSCMCDTSNSSCMMLPSRKNTCQKNWGKKSSVSSYGGTVKRQVL